VKSFYVMCLYHLCVEICIGDVVFFSLGS